MTRFYRLREIAQMKGLSYGTVLSHLSETAPHAYRSAVVKGVWIVPECCVRCWGREHVEDGGLARDEVITGRYELVGR